MVSHYYKTGRNITGDNFFTSVGLVEDLLQNGLTYIYIGTVRKNKKTDTTSDEG